MVKEYSSGQAFINENEAYLSENKFLSSFIFLDAPFLKEASKKNYALGVFNDNKTLLGLKVEPYNLLLYGDEDLLEELLSFIKDNNYELEGIYCSEEIGNKLLEISSKVLDKEYYLLVGMDFLKATEITEESSKEVVIPTLDDVDELYECLVKFVKDCGLNDKVEKDKIANRINDFRIIRKDNKIASLSRRSEDTDTSIRISAAYTRDEYRNQKLARKVVNNLKNEIINEGKIATLHVDQANPISYHLYTSLGFKKAFSQGIYLIKC